MTLDDLVGEHELSGVDFGHAPKGKWDYQEPNTMTFVLDEVAYTVIEDPDDGYRSSMRDIVTSDVAEVKNRFAPQRVVATHRARRASNFGSEACDVLELRDVQTGQIVLTAGTENTDDYYPYFVADFTPEHMTCNTPQK